MRRITDGISVQDGLISSGLHCRSLTAGDPKASTLHRGLADHGTVIYSDFR